MRLLNLGRPARSTFLPVLMLAFLFGLSMDYEVFLVSRIREEWAATSDNRRRSHRQATTGRVIIAAAAIMILVFSAFILSGRGHARSASAWPPRPARRLPPAHLPCPALMHLSGGANWSSRLARPRPAALSIEPATELPAPPARTRQPARAQHASSVAARETAPAQPAHGSHPAARAGRRTARAI